MSETDDTDVLLLIPPDFFLVRSSGSEDSILDSSRTVVHKPQSCTAQVIGKLVDQVYSLESRLESLEISTDTSFASLPRQRKWETDSFDSQSVDRKSFTFPRRRRRKVLKKERPQDLSLTSVCSASSKQSVPRLKLNFELASIDSKTSGINESCSMDDISSILSTPSKKNDRLLLHEIDEFLTKVETYESPESKYKDRESTLTPENVIKATGDYMSQKLGSKSPNDEVKLPSGRTVPSHMLDKYIYLVKNSSRTQSDKSTPSTSTSPYKAENYSSNAITETPKAQEESKAIDTKSPSIRRLNFSEHKDMQPTSTPKKQTAFPDTFRPTSNKIYDRASKVLEQYKSQNYSRSQISDPVSKEEFKMPQMRPYVAECKDEVKLHRKLMDTIDTDLLSLSELWGERGPGERGDGKLEEERLKREHCESMIQQLQKKVLEQQEKLAVAVKVDRAKDLAIAKLRDAWLKLTGSLDRAEQRQTMALDKMAREVDSYKAIAGDAQKKTSHFEAELYKTLDLAHDYQEKHKQLQNELKKLQEDKDRAIAQKEEAVRVKEKEVEVLKENYETVMRLNKQSTDFVKNLEQVLEKERTDHEQTKNKFKDFQLKIEAANEETALMAQERDALRDRVTEERARCSTLERQLAEKQNQVGELLSKCDSIEQERAMFRSGLEQQRVSLRAHYQQQLEAAVRAKLQEFQAQLDRCQRELQAAHGLQLASHAQRVDALHEQHKLEINVLEEKQKEEIKLYRLQLAQANEKIGLLEGKLEGVRRRRGALAAQLHSVMETQWRAACRLLTQAPGEQSVPALTPPASVRPELNLDGLGDTELQHYIKMLLTKPANVNGGDPHGGDPPDRDPSPTTDRDPLKDKGVKRILNASKPPWKA